MSKIKQAIEACRATEYCVDIRGDGFPIRIIPLESFDKIAAALELCQKQRDSILRTYEGDNGSNINIADELNAEILAILKGSEW